MKLTVEQISADSWILRKDGVYVASFSTKEAAVKYTKDNAQFLTNFLTK